MTPSLLFALLAVQQPAQPPAPLPQPVARVEVRPAEYALRVGDTVRLAAVAYDSSGRRLDSVSVRWLMGGGLWVVRLEPRQTAIP
jgi:hypothetical protein